MKATLYRWIPAVVAQHIARMALTPDMDRSLLCWALQPNLRSTPYPPVHATPSPVGAGLPAKRTVADHYPIASKLAPTTPS